MLQFSQILVAHLPSAWETWTSLVRIPASRWIHHLEVSVVPWQLSVAQILCKNLGSDVMCAASGQERRQLLFVVVIMLYGNLIYSIDKWSFTKYPPDDFSEVLGLTKTRSFPALKLWYCPSALDNLYPLAAMGLRMPQEWNYSQVKKNVQDLKVEIISDFHFT